MTKREITLSIIAIILLLLATCGRDYYIKNQTKKQVAHDTLVSAVISTQNTLNTKIDNKAISDNKSGKVIDSIKSYVKVLKSSNMALRNELKSNLSKALNLSDSILHYKLDSIEDINLVDLYADYLNSGTKDSLISKQDSIIRSKDVIIVQDSSNQYICNDALNACLIANKAKADLIKVDEKELKPHPILKFFRNVGLGIGGILATIGGYSVYSVLK